MKSSNIKASINQYINRKPRRSDRMEDMDKPRAKN